MLDEVNLKPVEVVRLILKLHSQILILDKKQKLIEKSLNGDQLHEALKLSENLMDEFAQFYQLMQDILPAQDNDNSPS